MKGEADMVLNIWLKLEKTVLKIEVENEYLETEIAFEHEYHLEIETVTGKF